MTTSTADNTPSATAWSEQAASDEMLVHQDELQKRLQAFEDMVAAEEQAAERTRQVEIENLTLAVDSAEKMGLTGEDIAAAEALLAQLRRADNLEAGATHLDTQTADAAAMAADMEARHTGALEVVEDQTQKVALKVGDAFQLVLPVNPDDGFIYRLRDAEYNHKVLGVVETKEKVTSTMMKVSWKAIGLAGGVTDFVIEFGVPWQGMEPLVYIEVTVDGPPPRGVEDVEDGPARPLGPAATARAAQRAVASASSVMNAAASAVTSASDEALEALEQEAKDAEAEGDRLVAEQDAELVELKKQLAAAQVKKAAMDSGSAGVASLMESERSGGGGGGSMTPREPTPQSSGGAAAGSAGAGGGSSRSSSVAGWSTAEVVSWLSGTMSLADVASAAEAEEVDGAIAVEMDNDAWKELGASALKAAKIVANLKKLG